MSQFAVSVYHLVGVALRCALWNLSRFFTHEKVLEIGRLPNNAAASGFLASTFVAKTGLGCLAALFALYLPSRRQGARRDLETMWGIYGRAL